LLSHQTRFAHLILDHSIPYFSGVVAGILYGLTYFLILRNPEHSFFRVKIGFPLIVGFCVAIYAAMFVLKGASNKGKGSDEWGVKDTVDNAKKGDGSELTIICVSAFLVHTYLYIYFYICTYIYVYIYVYRTINIRINE
jgi:hypothetical protein